VHPAAFFSCFPGEASADLAFAFGLCISIQVASDTLQNALCLKLFYTHAIILVAVLKGYPVLACC
jgi:hypothetical protein